MADDLIPNEPELVITEETTLADVMRYLAATQPDLTHHEAVTLATRMLWGDESPEVDEPTTEEINAAIETANEVAKTLTEEGMEGLSDEELAFKEENEEAVAEALSFFNNINNASLNWANQFFIGLDREAINDDYERMYSIMEALELLPPSASIDYTLSRDAQKSRMQSAIWGVLGRGTEDSLLALSQWAEKAPGVEFVGKHTIEVAGEHIPMTDVNDWTQAYAEGSVSTVLQWAAIAVYAGVPLAAYIHVMSNMDERPVIEPVEGARSIGPGSRRLAADRMKVAQRMKDGMELYSSPLLQMVYAMDPELAERLKSGDPDMTIGDRQNLASIIGSDETLLTQIPGMESRLQEIDYVMDLMSGEPTDLAVNEAAVLEAARTIAQSWNLDLDDDQLMGLTQTWKEGQQEMFNRRSPFLETEEVVDAFGTPDGDLAMRETIRNTPDYERFFRNKPGSQTEEEYVARFERQSDRLFGDLIPESIQAGMEAGDINAVGQSAIFSGEAEKSSQFLGRLAELGQALRKLT